jgi:acyl dehydratase
MTLTYQDLLRHQSLDKAYGYDQQQVILYGLGIGLGLEPRDERQLRFVLEDNLRVFPTFASVAAWDISFVLNLGIEWPKLIHLSQSMEIHQAFPPSARLLADNRIVEVLDKPKQNATILGGETIIRDADTGSVLADLHATYLARDFRVDAAPMGPARTVAVRPERDADATVSIVTSPQVALIYRLLGGRAKIHSTPSVARQQGFDGPIMHGLSTWGHACRAVLQATGDDEGKRLKRFSASFAAPVYPGEELTTYLWIDNTDVQFETWVLAREKLVLTDGRARLARQ